MKKYNKNNNQESIERIVTVDGLMTFGKTADGLHIADFACCDTVEITGFIGKCKVQAMRDGNVYIAELPKRKRNRPLFREDNSSLTLGHDGKYYFVFTLPAELVDELPQQLISEASSIARKVIRKLIDEIE